MVLYLHLVLVSKRMFRTEVDRTSAVCQVRLLGHCVTEDDRILVYRHVANGNLADHLHSKCR